MKYKIIELPDGNITLGFENRVINNQMVQLPVVATKKKLILDIVVESLINAGGIKKWTLIQQHEYFNNEYKEVVENFKNNKKYWILTEKRYNEFKEWMDVISGFSYSNSDIRNEVMAFINSFLSAKDAEENELEQYQETFKVAEESKFLVQA